MSEHSLTRQAMEAALRALEQQVQEEQAGTINSWLCPHFESCDPEGRIYTCSFALRKEYANPGGTLHGGLVGVIFDTAMGHLSALYAGRYDAHGYYEHLLSAACPRRWASAGPFPVGQTRPDHQLHFR